MIRPLRIVHRAAWPAIAAGLGLLVVAALVARQPVPVVPDVRPFEPARTRLGELEGRRADGTAFRATLLGASDRSDGSLALLLPVEALVGRPELLAYFIPQGVEPRIESGTLLGAARGGAALPLPVLANGTPGVIALYDLANDDVVATLHLPRRGAS